MIELSYRGFKVTDAELNEKGITYLLQYGFAKSMQDAVAGLHKDVTANIEDYRKDLDGAADMTDAQVIEAVVDGKLNERFDAIIAGTVGTRSGGTRLTGEAKFTRDVAIENLKAIAAAQSKKLPKEADKMAALVEKYLAKPANAEKVAAEVTRRMAAQAELSAGADDDELQID